MLDPLPAGRSAAVRGGGGHDDVGSGAPSDGRERCVVDRALGVRAHGARPRSSLRRNRRRSTRSAPGRRSPRSAGARCAAVSGRGAISSAASAGAASAFHRRLAARLRALGVPARAVHAAEHLQGRLAERVHHRRGERELQAGTTRLDHPRSGRVLRALRQVHPPRLHAALAGGGGEVQVPLPRQRLPQDGHQLRRAGAAPAGALPHHARRGRPARGRHERRLSLRARRLGQARARS